MRCLDGETGTEYSFDFSHREGNTVTNLATLHFSGSVSLACPARLSRSRLRARLGITNTRTALCASSYLDTADGLDRCCVPELCGSSFDTGCAGLALKLAPLFIAGSLDAEALEMLEIAGITVYYTSNGALCSTADA